ncbi:MAG: PilZ domain-containing protein [Deltaproteobacteria bacterium]|nr:PilZ domain-containing protein [Deltaproteobacteria bacterium]
MKMVGEGAGVLTDGRLARRVSAEQLGGDPAIILEIRDLSMESVEAKLLNISETGMGISTSGELFLGQMVNIATKADVKIPKKAVVMWSGKREEGYFAGLKFIRAS